MRHCTVQCRGDVLFVGTRAFNPFAYQLDFAYCQHLSKIDASRPLTIFLEDVRLISVTFSTSFKYWQRQNKNPLAGSRVIHTCPSGAVWRERVKIRVSDVEL